MLSARRLSLHARDALTHRAYPRFQNVHLSFYSCDAFKVISSDLSEVCRFFFLQLFVYPLNFMSTITIPFRGGHFSPFLPIHQNLLLLVHFFIISVLFLTFSKRLASVPQLMFLHVKSRWMLRPYVCYVPADLFVEVFPLCAW